MDPIQWLVLLNETAPISTSETNSQWARVEEKKIFLGISLGKDKQMRCSSTILSSTISSTYCRGSCAYTTTVYFRILVRQKPTTDRETQSFILTIDNASPIQCWNTRNNGNVLLISVYLLNNSLLELIPGTLSDKRSAFFLWTIILYLYGIQIPTSLRNYLATQEWAEKIANPPAIISSYTHFVDSSDYWAGQSLPPRSRKLVRGSCKVAQIAQAIFVTESIFSCA